MIRHVTFGYLSSMMSSCYISGHCSLLSLGDATSNNHTFVSGSAGLLKVTIEVSDHVVHIIVPCRFI